MAGARCWLAVIDQGSPVAKQLLGDRRIRLAARRRRQEQGRGPDQQKSSSVSSNHVSYADPAR
jgi:hypothetical protein